MKRDGKVVAEGCNLPVGKARQSGMLDANKRSNNNPLLLIPPHRNRMNEKAVKWCYVCCIRGRNIRHEERDADRYISSNQPKIIGQVIGDAPGAP